MELSKNQKRGLIVGTLVSMILFPLNSLMDYYRYGDSHWQHYLFFGLITVCILIPMVVTITDYIMRKYRAE
jgi:hypothetical protein